MVEALEQEGLIRKQEPYTHTVPFSHRSGERIEPLISLSGSCACTSWRSRRRRSCASGRSASIPSAGVVSTSTGSTTSGRGASRASCGGGTGCRSGTATRASETFVATQPPERCGICNGELRRDPDVLDTWFSSALWPFATLGWPDDTPELRAFYPTDVLVTARDIIFLWVARMVMMGMEFMHDVPFTDVDITSIIQAPDGRRMSKSLGTGIDPLDEIEAHGADAVRFGLLAMSSSQDVRYSAEKIQQGQQLANKMWNASRLVLLNVAEVEPAPRPRSRRGPLDPVAPAACDPPLARPGRRSTTSRTRRSTCTRSSTATSATGTWRWSSRASTSRRRTVSATLLHVLGQTLALAHPMMPFVTEEIYSFMPGADRDLAVSPFPQPDDSLLDEEAEREVGDVIEAVRRLRNYRDSVGRSAVGADPRADRGRSSR